MVYPSGTLSKRGQVLEALRALMATITTANAYFTDVQTAAIYSAHRLVIGGQLPAIVILPGADTRGTALSCGQDQYRMSVDIVGVIRAHALLDTWKDDAHKFVGDIQQALNSDRQLGNTAVYIEHESATITDGELENETILSASVAATIVYRIAVADTTT